jgi:hypothetical protein
MRMIDTFHDFVNEGEEGTKAAFEASRRKRIENGGYKMSDLMYEVFCCQSDISMLMAFVAELSEKKPAPKPKRKKNGRDLDAD